MKRYEFTQVDLVENFLKEKGSITTWQAFEIFGITRLSAKIYELRKKYNISSVNTTKKNRYGHYCENHTCSYPNCNNKKALNSNYCLLHQE